jgi:hypothetical protein
LLGQQLFALAQLHVGLGGGEVFPGAQHFGFGLVALGFQGAVSMRASSWPLVTLSPSSTSTGQAPGILLAICTSVASRRPLPIDSLRAAGLLIDFQ